MEMLQCPRNSVCHLCTVDHRGKWLCTTESRRPGYYIQQSRKAEILYTAELEKEAG